MKKLLLFTCITLLLAHCKPKNHYTIHGKITGKTNEEWVHLTQFYSQSLNDDSTRIVDGRFVFEGSIDIPDLYGLDFGKSSKSTAMIFLEQGDINVELDPENTYFNSTVSGSPMNDQYAEFAKTLRNGYEKKISKLDSQSSQASGKQREELKIKQLKTLGEEEQYKAEYIKSHHNNPADLMIMFNSGTLTREEALKWLSLYPERYKTTEMFKKSYTLYANFMPDEKAKQTIAFDNTKDSTSLTLNIQEQGILKAISTLNLQKVVIIDVWGSWCGICLKEFSQSNELYSEYSNKGVSFVYVAYKTPNENWKNLIDQYHVKGQHINLNKPDEKKLSDEIIQISAPRFILLNKTGEVVSYDAPRPETQEIRSTLDQLLLD